MPEKGVLSFKDLKKVISIDGSDLNFSGQGLETITFNDGIKYIVDGDFSKNRLTKINLPKSLIELLSEFSDNSISSLIIPDSVKTLESNFENNGMEKVLFGNESELTEITGFANNKLTFINLPNSLETIGQDAFRDNLISSLIIPDSVKQIGEFAFENNKIHSIKMSKNIESIGREAFGQNLIKSVSMENSIERIESDSFINNPGDKDYGNFVAIWIKDPKDTVYSKGNYIINPIKEAINQPYDSEDFVYKLKDNEEYEIIGFTNTGLKKLIENDFKLNIDFTHHKNIVITSIGLKAFENNNIKELNVSNSITEIKENAFFNNELVTIKLPESLASIGNYAFSNNQLTSLVLSDNLTNIGSGAFASNKLNSVTLPEKLTSIENGVFEGNNLTSITIPSSVKEIGDSAFYNNLLTDVIVGDGVETIGYKAFSGYRSFRINEDGGKNPGNQIKNLKLGKNIKTIESYAFYNNQLTNLMIPESVTTIKYSAFETNKLTNVKMPEGLTEIEDDVFYNNLLTSIEIPNSVKKIGRRAFGENKLSFLKLGSFVEKIDSHAFGSNELTEVDIPLSLKSLHENAFRNNLGMNREKQVFLYTKDRTNPNKLEDSKSHLINPKKINLTYVNENNEEIKSKDSVYVANGKPLPIKNIGIYTPYMIKEENSLIENNMAMFNFEEEEVNRTIIFKKVKIDKADGFSFKTKGGSTKEIGSEERLDVILAMAKSIPNIKDSRIEIDLPEYVNLDSIKVPKNSKIKEVKIDETLERITINLQDADTINILEIPVLFRFKRYETPRNTPIKIYTKFLDSTGKVIEDVKENIYTGTYENPDFEINLNGLDSWKKISFGGSDDDERITHPYNMRYSFKTKYYSSIETERNIGKYEFKVPVKKYVSITDDEKEELREPVLKNINDWKIEEIDGEKYYIIRRDELNNSRLYIPELILSFPNAKIGETYEIEADMTLTPKDQTEFETPLTYKNNFETTVNKILLADSFLALGTNTRNSRELNWYLYNHPIDLNREIIFTASFLKRAAEIDYKNFEGRFSLDDPRYEVTSVINKGDNSIILSTSSGESEIKPNEEFKLNQVKKITEFKFSTKNGEKINKNFDVLFKATPTSEFKNINFDNEKAEKTLHPKTKEIIANIHGKVIEIGGEKESTREAMGDREINIVPFDLGLMGKIKLATEKETIVTGEKIRFDLNLKSLVNQREYHGASSILKEYNLNNFKTLIKVPNNIEISNASLSGSIKNGVAPKIEFLRADKNNNYYLLSARKININVNQLAIFEGKLANDAKDGNYKIEMNIASDEISNSKIDGNIVKNEHQDILNTDTSIYANAYYNVATVKTVYVTKKIATADGLTKKSTIEMEKNKNKEVINYEISIVNTSNEDKEISVYDFVPAIGDANNSKFTAKILNDGIKIKDGAGNLKDYNFMVYQDENPTKDSKKLNVSDVKNSTGFNANLVAKAHSSVTFLIPVEVDLPSSIEKRLELAGEKIINSLHIEIPGISDGLLEADRVETQVELPANGIIKFNKYGLKKSIFSNKYNNVPLKGVEFELRDINGNFIKSAFSQDNGIVEFKDITPKDYIIKEIEAPLGYIKSNDFVVKKSDFKESGDNFIADLTEGVINTNTRTGILTVNKETSCGTKIQNSGEIIMTDDGNIYTYKSKIVEDSIAENLKDKLTRRPFKIDSQAVIPQIEAEKGIELSKEQLRAVECALNSNISVITGGAGTGKTQTIEMIVKSFLKVDKNLKIALLAPTGKAARRMKEATGLFSQTIHRYLGYSKDGTLDRLSHKDSDVVIVDEASMVDVELFYNLLRSIEKDSKLVLVGDENQIEPVGAGKVLKDLIDSNHITHTRLKEVFRQKEGSKIKDYSKRINLGEKIKDNIRTDRDPKNEFFIFNLTQTQEILYIMKREIERRLKDGTGINDIQVLSATKRGPLGTINLNSIIQKEFNKNSKADKPKFIKNQEKLYVGDKVVQNVNNYKLGVMNGEIGYYEGEDNGKYIFNFYGEEIEYEEEDLEELNLAYAITVHKSQGSEFDTVIFVVNDEDEMVTNKSIVYTAWTRAKNKLYTIGDIEYLDERLDSKYTINRNTALKEKLIA